VDLTSALTVASPWAFRTARAKVRSLGVAGALERFSPRAIQSYNVRMGTSAVLAAEVKEAPPATSLMMSSAFAAVSETEPRGLPRLRACPSGIPITCLSMPTRGSST